MLVDRKQDKIYYPVFRFVYPLYMPETAELRQTIRHVLEDLLPERPEAVEQALGRIMEAVEPFQRIAREELERFREIFAELAK
jgi:hypothetical protein